MIPPPFVIDSTLEQIRAMRKPALLICVRGTVRDVAAKNVVFHVKQTAPLPSIDPGKSDYLLEQVYRAAGETGPPPTLDNVMIQNWVDSPTVVDAFMQEPGIEGVVEQIYGKGYRFAIDRFGQQKASTTQSAKKLQDSCHVDYPEWKKVDFGSLPEGDRPVLEHVPIYPGHYCVIVIDQGAPHMIPTTGDSMTVYFPALSRAQHAAYEKATLAQLAKKPTPRSQHLPELAALSDISAIMALCLLTTVRPVMYPSGKKIDMPAPYNGSRFKYFNGCTMPPNQTKEVAAVIGNLKRKHGASVADPFEVAARQAKIVRCAADPSELTTATLQRIVGEPGVDIGILVE